MQRSIVSQTAQRAAHANRIQATTLSRRTALGEEPRALFYRYGGFTLAYATLQPGMKHFQAHGGYLAYDECDGRTFVLGDPVAPRENHADLIEAFIRHFPRSCFCQISKGTGAILDQLGWYVNEMGVDIELDLPTYDFQGPKKSKFRQAERKVLREGCTIEETCSEAVDALELEALCRSWLARQTVKHECRFLVRPFHFREAADTRCFALRDDRGCVVAFVIFDPICECGEVIGYSPAVKRHSPLAPTGAEEAITKRAIERFREEGLRTLRLGLVPLFDVQDSPFREAWLLKRFFQWAYEHADGWIYSFKGHADFKHRYRGRISKVYFGTYTSVNVWNLLALARLCRFF